MYGISARTLYLSRNFICLKPAHFEGLNIVRSGLLTLNEQPKRYAKNFGHAREKVGPWTYRFTCFVALSILFMSLNYRWFQEKLFPSVTG